MIRIESLTLQRGTKPLFENASAMVHAGEKAGLVGSNGSGKSTLFAMLRGKLHADGGELDIPSSWRVAHVAQETPAMERTALDYVLDGDTRLREIEAQLAKAQAAHDGHAEAEAHIAYADADGYTAASRAGALLLGLGFSVAETAQSVASFSGGWRMRLNLAQALMCPSDLLLLDEPTNHLDLDAIVWLEDWLKRYPGTLFIISHDREFLDGICDVTLHLENLQIKRYTGNYSAFETRRAEQLVLQQASYERQQREVAHLQSFVDRFRYKASKARQAQSRIKMLEKMEKLAPVHVSSPFSFEFREPLASPSPMLTLEEVRCGYQTDEGEKTVLGGQSFSLLNGQRIGLLGANGQGKSTLVKTLAGTLAPLAGRVGQGKGLAIGYFAQHQLETLREDRSPLQQLAAIAPGVREQDLRDFLGSFNFRGEMALAPVGPFSGGEKARLALALIIWQRPNLLLLDEPTNHLDLDMREALTVALAQFEGTLILVSHDRHLLRACADEFLLVGQGKVTPFDGDLDEYRSWLLKNAAARRAGLNAPAEKTDAGGNRKEQRREEAQERQRLAELRKPIQKEIATLEKRMEKLNAEKRRLDALLADEDTYKESNKTLLMDSLRQQAETKSELERVEAQWLEKQSALEAVS
ncbi:MAG TPA: ATP-binding cassette domain-containing protein [Gammaproteobacteria bacterium]|nr:ATP-binding cassette domain-containing protein [Gammaproteobacteria bacterium]